MPAILKALVRMGLICIRTDRENRLSMRRTGLDTLIVYTNANRPAVEYFTAGR